MSNIKKFYVGIKGVVYNTKLNKVLVLSKYNHLGQRYWNISGGRIDDNERIEETLKRELNEEITNFNNQFEIKELIHAYRLSRDLEDGLGLMLIFYKVETELENLEINEEHDGYKWVGLDELGSLETDEIYIESGYREALEKALEIRS